MQPKKGLQNLEKKSLRKNVGTYPSWEFIFYKGQQRANYYNAMKVSLALTFVPLEPHSHTTHLLKDTLFSRTGTPVNWGEKFQGSRHRKNRKNPNDRWVC